MKQIALLALVVFCLSLTAFAADVPKGDVFGGFSVDHAKSGSSSLTSYGWQASGAYNVHRSVGVVGDFGGQYKNGGHSYQYLFGPRFNARMDKVTYFGEAFYGGAKGGSSSRFAMAYGGGVDVMAGKWMVRVIQFDWIPIKGSNGGPWLKNNTRYGFGIVMPFGKK